MVIYVKRIFWVIVFILFFIPVNGYAFNISSKAATLYNLNDNEIIYDYNSNNKVSIASMTKIMTALVSLDKIDNLDSKVVMTSDMFKTLVEENASVAGFRVGEEVTYRDLLYGLMLPSGADAAQGLAISLYGSIDNFVVAMNNKAKELKLVNTHFANPTGLDNKNNYSTTYDVAQILMEALKNKEFKKIFTTRIYTSSNKRHIFRATITKYLTDTSFIDGSKTGFTYDAGLCMASISHYNDTSYLLVTAGASYNDMSTHIKDAKTIYNYYFKNYGYRNVINKGDKLVTVNYPDGREVSYYNDLDVSKYLINSCNLSSSFEGDTNLSYGVKLNSVIGKYIVKCDNKEVYSKEIRVVQSFKEKKEVNYTPIIIILILFILIIILFIVRMIINGLSKKRRNKKRISRVNK